MPSPYQSVTLLFTSNFLANAFSSSFFHFFTLSVHSSIHSPFFILLITPIPLYHSPHRCRRRSARYSPPWLTWTFLFLTLFTNKTFKISRLGMSEKNYVVGVPEAWKNTFLFFFLLLFSPAVCTAAKCKTQTNEKETPYHCPFFFPLAFCEAAKDETETNKKETAYYCSFQRLCIINQEVSLDHG